MKGQSHCGMGLCPNKRSQIRTRAPMCCCPRVTRLSPIRSCKLAARGVQQCASWAPTRQAHMPSSSTWLHTSMCMLSRSRRGPRTDMNRTSRCCDTGTKPAQTFVRRALNFHDFHDWMGCMALLLKKLPAGVILPGKGSRKPHWCEWSSVCMKDITLA